MDMSRAKSWPEKRLHLQQGGRQKCSGLMWLAACGALSSGRCQHKLRHRSARDYYEQKTFPSCAFPNG
jgi:hypothetical protein